MMANSICRLLPLWKIITQRRQSLWPKLSQFEKRLISELYQMLLSFLVTYSSVGAFIKLTACVALERSMTEEHIFTYNQIHTRLYI